MIKNYFKTAWRNLSKNKMHSFINISGLSIGMAVAILIGLWIYNERSFNKYFKNYDRIASVMLNHTVNNSTKTGSAIPLPLEAAIRKNYGSDFKHIVMMSFTENHVLSVGDKKITYPGNFMGAEGPEMLTLNMLEGNHDGLKGPSSILISRSVAGAMFGENFNSYREAVGKTITLDNKASFTVSGVYEDLPQNTTFNDLGFIAPWDFYASHNDWIGRDPDNWSDNSLFMYVQTGDNSNMAAVSQKIKNVIGDNAGEGVTKKKPALFLQPMSKWHLYSEFKNGVNTGGAIRYVWLFGIIGAFVLLLACINFMNLSTARSEKRAKEVGIRKAVGSRRSQLVGQFFYESVLTSVLAFVLALLLVWLMLPFFNEVSGKKIDVPFDNITFWLVCIAFTLFTGIIAGSYPALYLSSFRPIKVLKGTFKAGRLAAIPRKVLVVTQFTVSVILIIGTIIVFKQIQFAKDRPVGYSRDGLIDIEMANNDLPTHFQSVRSDLLKTGSVAEVTGSSSPTTGINYNRGDVSWNRKDPSLSADFGNFHVTTEYGKTVGWHFADGRDFSTELTSDSSSVILNEAAVKYMALKNPVGQMIKIGKKDYNVIGVVNDMVMGSPYQPVKQSVFLLTGNHFDDMIIKINPDVSTSKALSEIEKVCKTYSPSVPFSYQFVDEEYAKKFASEQRIGNLAGLFAALAIFISCLGIFGMATFVAEQRRKEVSLRKVLGASIFSVWKLLSKDFVILVFISLLIAAPTAYYFMHGWLQNYDYRTNISWWIFIIAGAGALIITLATVSFQAIKAAIADPVKSLRTE